MKIESFLKIGFLWRGYFSTMSFTLSYLIAVVKNYLVFKFEMSGCDFEISEEINYIWLPEFSKVCKTVQVILKQICDQKSSFICSLMSLGNIARKKWEHSGFSSAYPNLY